MTNEITCPAHLNCLDALKKLKEACRVCESYCHKIYYKDIHGKSEFKEDSDK